MGKRMRRWRSAHGRAAAPWRSCGCRSAPNPCCRRWRRDGGLLRRPQQASREGPTDPQLLSVVENGDVVAAEPRLYFADPVDVDDGGPVDAPKARGVERAIERAQAETDAVLLVADVQAHVVSGPLEPVDVGGANEEVALVAADGDAKQVARGRRQAYWHLPRRVDGVARTEESHLVEEGAQAGAQRQRAVRAQDGPRAGHGIGEAL